MCAVLVSAYSTFSSVSSTNTGRFNEAVKAWDAAVTSYSAQIDAIQPRRSRTSDGSDRRKAANTMSDDDFWGMTNPPPHGSRSSWPLRAATAVPPGLGLSDDDRVDDFGTDGGGSYDPYDSSELDDLGDLHPHHTAHLALRRAGLGLGGSRHCVVLRFMISGRPSGVTVAVAVVGWLLSGVVAVLGVAAYQRQDLASAASMTYAPHPSAALLRLLPLVIGAVGVVLCSWYLADWASRL